MSNQFNDEEETKVYTVLENLSNDQIAEMAKLDHRIKKVVNSMPMPSKFKEIFTEILVTTCKEIIEAKTKRLGERIGALEKKITELKHTQELRDVGQENNIKDIKKDLQAEVKSGIRIAAIIGFFVTVISTIVAAYISRG